MAKVKARLKKFRTEEYKEVKGQEIAVGIWEHPVLPKVGDMLEIDSVPLEVKGVKNMRGKDRIGILI